MVELGITLVLAAPRDGATEVGVAPELISLPGACALIIVRRGRRRTTLAHLTPREAKILGLALFRLGQVGEAADNKGAPA